jgi:K+-sensing histidine kinase KdpD
MIRSELRQPEPRAHKVAYYAMAVLSVAVGMIAADHITRLLHAEAIASSMLCAIIFAAWFGGLSPALLAIGLALLAFHYDLVLPINSFASKYNILAVDISRHV